MKTLLDIRVDQVKTMIELVLERGLTPPVSSTDVDDVLTNEEMSETQKMRVILSYHTALHEIVYAPPSRN